MDNPYKALGVFEPFSFLGINFMVDEAFKKVLCAGMSGRLKSTKQDLKEAVYSLERAIKASHNGEVYSGKATQYKTSDINNCMAAYESILKTPEKQLAAARMILIFMQSNNPLHLKDAIEALS